MRSIRFQLATLAHGDVALNFSEHRDRFRFDFAANVRVLTDRQHAIRIDFALDLSVNEKLFLELDRAFDFDIAREDVFAAMICHSFSIIAG